MLMCDPQIMMEEEDEDEAPAMTIKELEEEKKKEKEMQQRNVSGGIVEEFLYWKQIRPLTAGGQQVETEYC